MLSLKEFKKFKLPILNHVKGGVEDTTYKKTDGFRYKDYKYSSNELNETDSYDCQCNKYGGTDKTNTLICD